MNIKGKICQSGGKKTTKGRIINEDGLEIFDINYDGKIYNFIILMDGATGLGKDYGISKGKTSAEWYVEFMISEIKKILSENPTVSFEEVIESAVSKVINKINKYQNENNIILEEYEKPSAGIALLRSNRKITDIFLLGDTEIIVAYKNGEVLEVDNPNQKLLKELDASVMSRMVEIAEERGCNVIDTGTDPEIKSMLQINRAKKNVDCEGAYWVCGTTLGVAKHGTSISINNGSIEGIILATDGFDYSMLELNQKEVYELIKKYGTEYVAKAIRDAQEKDSKCNKYPRFKKSDDLTVLYADMRQKVEKKNKEKDRIDYIK